MVQITHFIDRQFGCPVHLGTENDIIKFVAKAENSEQFNKKFSEALINKTIPEAKAWLGDTFKGGFIQIIMFPTPLQSSIEDYK